MPKGRARLTTTKKRSRPARIPLGRDEGAPTAQEWAAMAQYNTFEVQDEDGKGYAFSVNDIARVLPHGYKVGAAINTHQYWIGKILDVRANNPNDVWVRVHWFYSARDAAGVDRTFDPSHCGKYERLQSNHVDCVSSSAFDGLAPVKHYDETNLNQEPILPNEFYYRYTIHISDKSISPTPRATCDCNCLYNPSDTAENSVMHFCPQPACRKYYHRGCISSKGTITPCDRTDFLLSDPDTGAALPLNESASAEPPKKRRRASHTTAVSANLTAFGALLKALPPVLLSAAAQPIVRGGVFGVAGNVAAVIAARRVVCGALRDGTSADGWEARMPEGWEKTMPVGWDLEEVVLGGEMTPDSNLSASVGGSKGKANKRKGKAKANATVVLQCPACGGPI
ncbi:hypothetical protein B0H19DRAFT_1144620 [Mycena capillaripes]|nr:hypothetical protein B0H19DRAFT_1144620 [Mycena capillaripes]